MSSGETILVPSLKIWLLYCMFKVTPQDFHTLVLSVQLPWGALNEDAWPDCERVCTPFFPHVVQTLSRQHLPWFSCFLSNGLCGVFGIRLLTYPL